MSQKSTIVISDIHMGTNHPTNWYQKGIHQPYLAYILKEIIKDKDKIDELVILGDLFDFWTCPPDETPPTAADIISENSDILGPNGLLNEVLKALNGRVSYVRGNHDITTTQEELNLIGSTAYHVKLQPDVYVKDGVVYTHGHLYTMFNAPDVLGHTIPVGHYVTRAVSYMLKQKGESAAHESGFGAAHMGYGGLKGILKDIWAIKDRSVVVELLTAIHGSTNLPWEKEIKLKHSQQSGSKQMTLVQAKTDYENLASTWLWKYSQDQGRTPHDLCIKRGLMFTYKAIWADYDGSYLGWYAQQLAFKYNAALVVMGHTHIPRKGLEGDMANYINTGFECVPTPDMPKDSMTFGLVTHNGGNTLGSVLAVKNDAGTYKSVVLDPPKAQVFGEAGSDYSCYVTIENHTSEDFIRTEFGTNYGYFAVEPPNRIPANSTVKLWIQDFPALLTTLPEGTVGSAVYHGEKSHRKFDFTVECPFNKILSSNTIKGGGYSEVWSKSESVHNKWVGPNKTKKEGNPFFVKFILG